MQIKFLFNYIFCSSQEFVQHDIWIALTIADVEFPNQTIGYGWYQGKSNLHTLNLFRCVIMSIQANAFKSNVFKSLNTLNLRIPHPIQYEIGILNGLRALIMFFVDTGSCIPEDVDLLSPARRNLQFFNYYIDRCPPTPFRYLFGVQKLSNLQSVTIICHNSGTEYQTLAASNFTALVRIEWLTLHCDIAVIQPNTFDFIGETLVSIDLSANRLTRIHVECFDIFLDRNSYINSRWQKRLLIAWNPLRCDLEFYKLRNRTLISFGYADPQTLFHCTIATASGHSDRGNDTQIMHPGRFALQHHGVDTYAFRNFQLAVNSATKQVEIVQAAATNYRIIFMEYFSNGIGCRTGCPNSNLIRARMRCVQLHRPLEQINVWDAFPQVKLVVVCVIFMSATKRFLPLHCLTVRYKSLVNADGRPDRTAFFFGIVIFVGLLLFAVATVVTAIVFRSVRSRRDMDMEGYV